MTAPVILLCFFLAFCPLSVGTPLTCPPPFLNESAQQGSGRLCATLQLQTKLPCPSVNLSVRENEKLNPEKWHLKSLLLKVEKACSFMVFKQDEQRQHFPGGFNANIPINAINTQSEFLCICTEAAIREGVAIGGGRANGEDVAIEERETIRGRRDVIRGVAIEHVAGAESSVVVAGEAGVAVARGEPVGNEESEATGLFPIFFGLFAMLFV